MEFGVTYLLERLSLLILAAGTRFQLKRSALHDAEDDGGPPVIMGSGLAEDFADRRHLVIVQVP
jgi:hypothetical protein